jgi:ATP-dependent RNA helicase SUPV3L1/SUV3
VLGPTNTGKTHLAVERMLGHASGMIGLPLRLLAREIYDRIVKVRGARSVALITGEEKIVPPRARLFRLHRRGHAAVAGGRVPGHRRDPALRRSGARPRLHPPAAACARHRTRPCCWARPPWRRWSAAFCRTPRSSTASGSPPDLRGIEEAHPPARRSAVVAFSADQVYAIAELIRRQRGGAAVVMGRLSPRTRNAQVALYQSGEVDFLVATDAIGMGLNMDVDHVAFAGLRKFDGKRSRFLHPQEIGQIAGRAGRYQRDGTFGVTGECEDMDPDLVEAVENHRFQPVTGAQWRNAKLDFDNAASPAEVPGPPPERPGLKLAERGAGRDHPARLAADPDIADRARDRVALATGFGTSARRRTSAS